MSRRALLVGAADYGDGFQKLPAVENDIAAVASAMASAGYEVDHCPPAVASSAGELDKALREFCRSGSTDDVRLVYFSGHGMRMDDVDWIVPAGSRRADVVVSATQRVSTDLSATVAESETGLVVFLIDACRDPNDAPSIKSAAATPLRRPGEARFVRFFGCAADQVCQVVSAKNGDVATSLFAAALAKSLAEPGCTSLDELQQSVERHCKALLDANTYLRSQSPRLAYGELSEAKRAVLRRPIFEPAGVSALSSVWSAFEPDRLQCLCVLSEFETERAPPWGLNELVSDALAGETGDRIWAAFRKARVGLHLADGAVRNPPEAFSSACVAQASFSVLEAFASEAALERAIRAVVEADLAIFDLTEFEPAVMLLLGVRSACRRAITVCSHANGWREGMPLELPFNLQDLNISSHTPRDTRIGPDPVVERFVCRVETGFTQLAKHPGYVDLPGFEELRQVGSAYEAARTIDVRERILVLCSYSDDFFENWEYLRRNLKNLLWRGKAQPDIERIIDYGTPQLVRQGLYEQIRRVAACVVDWSEFRASVFLELGARLAVSEWGAVQVIDERWLPGGTKAPKLKQLALLQQLFQPVPYAMRGRASTAFDAVADDLLNRSPGQDGDAAYNRIHRTLLPVIGKVQPAHTGVVDALARRADALHHPDQSRQGAPQALFFGNQAIKRNNERAALELRVAAWLYLEHRIPREQRRADPRLEEAYRSIGKVALGALYDLGDPASIELAAVIEARLGKSALATAMVSRKKGDALRGMGHEAEALEAYRDGLAALQELHELGSRARSESGPAVAPGLASDLAEVSGTSGGLLQRLGEPAAALEQYREGARLEEAFRLPSTYNRLNVVKLELLTGVQTLAALTPRIDALAAHIRNSLAADKSLSDSGWAHADLGDCLALLGQTDEAARAYATFIAKAEIKSPARALDVLRQVAQAMREHDDADVGRLQDAIVALESRLRSVEPGVVSA